MAVWSRQDISRGGALRFVALTGIDSPFADMIYEGARGITGPYLVVLGASETVIGIVAGTGELIGYALRLVSGYLADRLGRYWLLTIVGYCINLLAVPLLALAVLAAARRQYPRPQDLEHTIPTLESKGLRCPYLVYLAAGRPGRRGLRRFPFHCLSLREDVRCFRSVDPPILCDRHLWMASRPWCAATCSIAGASWCRPSRRRDC